MARLLRTQQIIVEFFCIRSGEDPRHDWYSQEAQTTTCFTIVWLMTSRVGRGKKNDANIDGAIK